MSQADSSQAEDSDKERRTSDWVDEFSGDSEEEASDDQDKEDEVEGEEKDISDEEELESDDGDVQSVETSNDSVVESTELNDGDAIDDSGGIQAGRPFVRSAAPSLA